MSVGNITSFIAVIATFLIMAAGFCLILQLGKLAGRLFILALSIFIAPGVVTAVANAIPSAAPAFGLGALAVGALAWFLVRLRILRTFQNWVIPRFGREVDGQVTGTYALRLFDSIFGAAKLIAIAALVSAVLLLWR